MDIRSYGLPTLFATLLHVVVLGALLSHWIGDVEPERRSTPHIQARMIDLEAFSNRVAPPTPAPQPDREAEDRKAAQEKADREKARQEETRRQAEAKRQQEIQKQKAAEEAQRQKQVAEQKRKAEAEVKRKQAELEAKRKAEALAKRKAEEEAKRQAQAQAKREAQEKAKAEAAAKAKAKAEAEAKALAQAEAKARAEAEAVAKAQAEARQAAQQRAESVVGDMQGYIQALIQRNWLVPKTARNGMEAVVAIRLLGNGEVDQASIYKSSGNAAFDNSALQAVYRTERFERVAEVDPILFERRLRSIHIVFRPEGLRW